MRKVKKLYKRHIGMSFYPNELKEDIMKLVFISENHNIAYFSSDSERYCKDKSTGLYPFSNDGNCYWYYVN